MMIAAVRPTRPAMFLPVFPVARFCGGVVGAGLRWVCWVKAAWARIALVRSVPASMTPRMMAWRLTGPARIPYCGWVGRLVVSPEAGSAALGVRQEREAFPPTEAMRPHKRIVGERARDRTCRSTNRERAPRMKRQSDSKCLSLR